MSEKITFQAPIITNDRGGAFVEIPFDVEKTYGKKRVKINATIDGESYRGSLVRMGSPKHILGVLKAIREKISKGAGDVVTITLEEDTAPRVVEVPDYVSDVWKTEAEIWAFFQKLSYTHQREYINWITEAKKEETKQRRILKAIEMMRKGKKGV